MKGTYGYHLKFTILMIQINLSISQIMQYKSILRTMVISRTAIKFHLNSLKLKSFLIILRKGILGKISLKRKRGYFWRDYQKNKGTNHPLL